MGDSRGSEELVQFEEHFKPVDEILRDAGLNAGGGPTEWGSSFWARAKKCLYLAMLTRAQGFEPARTQPLVVGILFHAAMFFWYKSRDRAAALRVCQAVLDWCRAALDEGGRQGISRSWPQNLWSYAVADQRLVTSYMANYIQAPAGSSISLRMVETMDPPQEDILFVERDVYAMPPQGDFPISCRYDAVFRVIDPTDGKLCVVLPDHKTTRNASPEWEEAWWQDDQMMALFYVWQTVMEPLGWPPARAVMVNTIEKPRSRNDEPNFRRLILPLRPDRMAVWKAQMRYAYERLVEAEAAFKQHGLDWRHVPQNWSSCFGMKYSVCEQLPHCLGLRDMSVYEQPALPPAVPEQTVTLEQTTWWLQFCASCGLPPDSEPRRMLGKPWMQLTEREATRCIETAKAALARLMGPAQVQPVATLPAPAAAPVPVVAENPQPPSVSTDKGQPQPASAATPAPVPPSVPTVAEQELDDQRLARLHAVTNEARRLEWSAETLQAWIEKRFSNELTLGDLTDSELRLVRNELAAMQPQAQPAPAPVETQAPSPMPQPAQGAADSPPAGTLPPAPAAAPSPESSAPAAQPPAPLVAVPAPAGSVTMFQIEKMGLLAAKLGWNYQQLCDWVFVRMGRPLTDLTAVEADLLMTALGEPEPPVKIYTKPEEKATKDQWDALGKALAKVGWKAAQAQELAKEMFKVREPDELTRSQMKQLILQVYDRGQPSAPALPQAASVQPAVAPAQQEAPAVPHGAAGGAGDVVKLPPPEAAPPNFDDIMQQVSGLTNHSTDAIAAWLRGATEPMLREYAARFPGQGDRFNNIRSLERLRSEIACVTLEDVQAQLAAGQQIAPPPELTVEALAARIRGKVWKPVGFQADRKCSVTEAVTGNWYLVRGLVAMATPKRDEKQRTFLLDSGVELGVGYTKTDTTEPLVCVLCDMVDASAGPTPPQAELPVEGAAGGPVEEGLPRKVGEAAKATGVVPVWWLGHHKQGKKALAMLQAVAKEGDSFGIALCGKGPDTEKLKAYTLTGFDTGAPVAVETTAKTVGSAVWEHFGTLVKGL